MKLTIKEFLIAIKKYKTLFLKSIIWVLLVAALDSLIPFAFKQYLSFSIESNTVKVLLIFASCFIGYLLLKILFKICWYRSLDSFGGAYLDNLVRDSQNKIIKDCSYLEIEKNKNSKIKHILYVDSLNVFTSIGHHLPSLISSIIILIATFVLSIFINPIFTIIIFVSFLLGLFISILSKKIISGASANTNFFLKNFNYSTSSFLDCLEIGKANNLNEYFNKKSSDSIKAFINAAKKEDTKTYFWSGLSEGYSTLLTYVLSAILVLPLFDGTIVNYAFFTLICSIVLGESQKIVSNLRLIFKSQVSFKNVNDLKNKESKEIKYLEHINRIHSNNLNFSIDDKQIINNLSFDFKKGELIRIQGPNGSGKSTLIKLITGLYPNDKIIYNDNEVGNPNKKMIYIDQNEMFLNETVADYLSIMIRQDINKDAILEDFSFLHFDNKLLDKHIENFGENLSNGEKKKILILRMLLKIKEVDLIILDEIMSGLDVETKKGFIEYIQNINIKKDKIFIIVEHDSNLNLVFDKTINL